MNVDYASQPVTVNIDAGWFTFTPTVGHLELDDDGGLALPPSMHAHYLRMVDIQTNMRANVFTRTYGDKAGLWFPGIENPLPLNVIREAVQAFIACTPDWEARSLMVSIREEIVKSAVVLNDLRERVESEKRTHTALVACQMSL